MEYNRCFKKDCKFTAFQKDTNKHVPKLIKAYQDYTGTYIQNKSLYIIYQEKGKINLLIYSTERESQEKKILETPELLDLRTCLAQLPNGKIFCYGNRSLPNSGITVMIDENGKVHKLPSGTPCGFSSAIYFNSNIYCFGGVNQDNHYLTLSCKFDLNKNRWIKLTSMPKADQHCTSVVFNGNILIYGYENANLMLYSIDIDSFSTINCEFAKWDNMILASAEKRLYLIGRVSIYESDFESYTSWSWIADSVIRDSICQVYCSFNAGTIYIGYIHRCGYKFYKFGLSEKRMTRCFEDKFSFRKTVCISYKIA